MGAARHRAAPDWSHMARTVAVIGALEKEVRQVFAELEGGTERKEAGLTVAEGPLGAIRVVATVAGMGTVNAAAAAQHLVSRYGAEALLFSGIAGGLNPALHIGDVVVGRTLRYLDTDTALIAESAPGLEEFASSAALARIARSVLAAHGYIDLGRDGQADAPRCLLGTIATGDRFVTGAAMREAAVAATGADCVEMEGAAIAHVAAKNEIPCLVLRAVSDNCDEAYDAFCDRVFDLDEYARTASSVTLDIIRALEGEDLATL